MSRERVVAEVPRREIPVINETKSVGCSEGIPQNGQPSRSLVGTDIDGIIRLYKEIRLRTLGYLS